MSITVTEDRKSPTYSRNKPRDSPASRTFVRHFTIVADSLNTGPEAIYRALNIREGDAYEYKSEYDEGARCEDIKINREEKAPRVWHASVTYKASFPSSSGGDEEDDEEIPPSGFHVQQSISWGSETLQYAAKVDEAGDAVVNSAKDQFDPPLMFSEPILIMTIARNEQRYGGNAFSAYSMVTNYIAKYNSADFFGFGQHTVLCVGIGSTPTTINRIPAWRVTYTFKIRPDNWDEEPLDYGRNALVGGKKVRCTDKKGMPIEDRLDGAGAQLAVAAADVFLGPFEMYKEADFNDLNFSTTGSGA